MSVIRLAHPGLITEFVDLGPSTGRVTFSRRGSRGSELIVVGGTHAQGSGPKPGAKSQAEYRAREAQKARERRAAR